MAWAPSAAKSFCRSSSDLECTPTRRLGVRLGLSDAGAGRGLVGERFTLTHVVGLSSAALTRMLLALVHDHNAEGYNGQERAALV